MKTLILFILLTSLSAVKGGRSFTDLQEKIDANEGTIEITEDYEYNEKIDEDLEKGILIDQNNIKINGNGHTINGCGKSRIFNINADNITISNLNFENGNNNTGGGAIKWTGHKGKLIDCNFNGNFAPVGGAICTYTNNMRIYGCRFENGNADKAAAINWVGLNGKIKDCSFSNLTARENGGAVHISHENTVIENCSFRSTSSEKGGAIYLSSATDGAIVGCRFENIGTKRTGAIHYSNCKSNIILGCEFAGNRGGAISETKGRNNTIFDCTFLENKSDSCGMITMNGLNSEIDNCNFYDNESENGLIKWKCMKGKITNSTFENNLCNEIEVASFADVDFKNNFVIQGKY